MSWNDLLNDYFDQACRSVLGPYLEAHGFAHLHSGPASVMFARGEVFTQFTYWSSEDEPGFRVLVGVGLLESSQPERRPRGRAVPAWRLIPAEAPGRAFQAWAFDDEGQLLELLGRVRDLVLEAHVMPVAADPARLRGLLAETWGHDRSQPG